MRIGLRHISDRALTWLEGAVREPGRTRGSLARGLCAEAGWVNGRGEPCVAQAQRALPRLAEGLGIELPAARPRPAVPPGEAGGRVERGYPDLCLRVVLDDLGEVRLEPVAAGERRLWRSMMATHHPNGWSRRPGRVLNYWIVSERCGRLGGIGFCAAQWRQRARDALVGWSADARAANLGLLVENHRFLILPGVRVPNLASRVLSLAARRLPEDWQAHAGQRPLAIYTYVSPEHSGTCYAAAGWRRCPRATEGLAGWRRRRPTTACEVLLKPLSAAWREALARETRAPLGAGGDLRVRDGMDWADVEYARCAHTDGRVRDRMIAMGRAWENAPGARIPEIFPGEAAQKAAYRLLSNGGVTMEHIVSGHREATVERCRGQEVVLAVQDTTSLNYSALGSAAASLDRLGGGNNRTLGIPVHAGLAITESRRPLGAFHIDADFRRRDGKDSLRWLEALARAAELDDACPGTRVVTVCDREGDIWDLLAAARRGGRGLLVRADRGARRRVASAAGAPARCLWEATAELPVLATRAVKVAARGASRASAARKGRTARLEVRAAEFDILPPQAPPHRRDGPPGRLLAVRATERNPPPSAKEPPDWLLLTTEGGPDRDSALRALRWYEARWTIEEYFRILKTGTRVEDRRLDHADDLRRCLAFDAITAWRVMDLERRARDTPDRPAAEMFSEREIDALYILLQHYHVIRAPPDTAPNIRSFVIDLARLVGFIPSRRQPLPGTQKLWEGWRKYSISLNAMNALIEQQQREAQQ